MTREQVFLLIQAHLADELDVEPVRIEDSTRFKEDLEADSLDLYTLVQELEDSYGIRISDEEAARILGLSEYLNRKPAQLSGGQRQRVAMGRAIVRNPAAFLMDEPLSNLDAKLRVQTRAEIMRLQRRIGVATMYVTHDQTEAMTMGDRVAVLRDGYLQQVAPPQVLYDTPVNTFVAGFIGSPAMNMYYGEVDADGAYIQLA